MPKDYLVLITVIARLMEKKTLGWRLRLHNF